MTEQINSWLRSWCSNELSMTKTRQFLFYIEIVKKDVLIYQINPLYFFARQGMIISLARLTILHLIKNDQEGFEPNSPCSFFHIITAILLFIMVIMIYILCMEMRRLSHRVIPASDWRGIEEKHQDMRSNDAENFTCSERKEARRATTKKMRRRGKLIKSWFSWKVVTCMVSRLDFRVHT